MQMFKVEAAKTMGIEGDLTDADLSVVLTYLARDKAAIAYNHQVRVNSSRSFASLTFIPRL